MSTFAEMAVAAIDALAPEARANIDPTAFTQIIAVCAEIAERESVAEADDRDPEPRLCLIEARFLVPGDFLWRNSTRMFSLLQSVHLQQSEIVITDDDGATESFDPKSPTSVAANRNAARAWNIDRAVRADAPSGMPATSSV